MVTPGICIAAAASGTGKTTIATGLIAALARRCTVAPFKVGPDYIDPGYHTIAAGRVGRNLDSVMCGLERIGPLYAHGSEGADLSVVEGVMGLFDGRIPDGAGSTADVAAALGLPVILIVDVRGMSQSAGALVRGFAMARSDVRIAGVILNQAGTERHAKVCKDAVEAEGIPVVGIVPRMDKVEVPSRHLGLVTAAEQGGAAVEAVQRMADLVEQHCDLDAIVSMAHTTYSSEAWDPSAVVDHVGHARVAMAGGPVFTFAYAEHQELLEACGAEVVHFDPLQDAFPECDALIIPGGFPEEHVEALSSRADMREAIRKHVASGKAVHGECAGLLWLLESLDAHSMLGVIPTHAAMGRRLTLGYREAVALHDSLLYRSGERVIGHEFHHTALTDNEVSGWHSAWGWRAWDGKPKREGFVHGAVHASYLHVHPAAVPQAVQRLVEYACKNDAPNVLCS
ncbi:MAG: cobyrinate a,c-diamide synthase [Corynebacterium sp.]|nr:cobyrinate a,c-diamide synthase [Corynebacterium sp.]